jgi:hypothetical protein
LSDASTILIIKKFNFVTVIILIQTMIRDFWIFYSFKKFNRLFFIAKISGKYREFPYIVPSTKSPCKPLVLVWSICYSWWASVDAFLLTVKSVICINVHSSCCTFPAFWQMCRSHTITIIASYRIVSRS